MKNGLDRDIVSTVPQKPYVVCGFFTADYRPLAERLAKELRPSHPYHFFFREKGQTPWHEIVRWKPDIVLEAMNLYPGTSAILLDMDCSVLGSLDPMLDFTGDVSAYPLVRAKRPWPLRKLFHVHVSSRCMVFKPTERTKAFLEAWREECKDKQGVYTRTGDEMAMLVALLGTTGLSFCPMDVRYSGRQGGKIPPGAVVIHASYSRGFDVADQNVASPATLA
jgi:hypothetical protein